MTPVELCRVDDEAAAARAALELILQAATRAIAEHGRFTIALCGGSTPRELYTLLAGARQDWRPWHLVYGDERCLPHGDGARNSSLVEQCWLSGTDFPAGNHHLPRMELGAAAAAADYAAAIEALLPLDLALLGMGEDGHTASLFPGHSHPDSPVVAVHNAPKPPSDRISLSYATLCAATQVCFLVTGAAKRDILLRYLAGENLPATRVAGRERTVLVTDVRGLPPG